MSGPTHPARREALLATLVLGAITCIWFWPLFTGDQLGQSFVLHRFAPWLGLDFTTLPQRGPFVDAAVAFHPWGEVVRDQLLSGHLPLWNPYEWAGTTLIGNMQSAVFFPLNWILIAMPVEPGWGVMAAAKTLVSGLGAYVLARELRVDRGGALVAGAVYMLSEPLMLWLQYPLGSVFAVFPWLMWATTRLARRPTPGAVALTAVAFALILFAGHPESTFIAVSAIAVYLVALVLFDRSANAQAPAPLTVALRWIAAGVLGALIAAVAVVPFLLALGESVTWGERGRLNSADAPALSDLLQWAMPGLFGEGEPALYGRWPFGYFGLPALLLAFVGLARYRRRPEARALLTMVVVVFLVIYRVPPVRWLVEEVPPWANTYLGPERVYFVIALAGAIGAGAGVAALCRRPMALRRVALVVAGAGVAIAAGFALAQLAGDLGAPASVKRGSIAVTALLLVATGALMAMLGRVRATVAATAAVALAVVSLAGMQNFNLILPPSEAYPRTPRSIEVLQAQTEPFRVGVIRSGAGGDITMPANTAALYGLESIEGYDYPLSTRWSDFQSSVLGFGGSQFPELRTAQEPPSGAALAGLRMMNVGYYLGAPGTRPPTPDFEEIYSGPDAVVLRDRGALPRAYLAPATRALPDEQALATLVEGDLDPRRETVVPAGAEAASGGGFRAARVERVSPEHVRVHVPEGAGGWLVLANAYSSDWKAESGGRELELRPTNYAAMGVAVEGGEVVDFRLDRTAIWIGAALSLIGLACAGLLAASGRARRRREPAPGPHGAGRSPRP
jgi:hypothetical protein